MQLFVRVDRRTRTGRH